MSAASTLIRQALVSWASSFAAPLGLGETINAEPPEPGAKPALPTLACWFPEDTHDNRARRVLRQFADGTTLDLWGWRDADVAFRWRLGNEIDAQTVRDEWPALADYAAADAGDGKTLAMPLEVDLGIEGVEPFDAKLYFTGRVVYAAPELTQVRGLWEVVVYARLIYPDITRSPSAVGVMNITVTIDGESYVLSDGADPIAPPDEEP